MLSEAQIQLLAEKANKKVNLPIVGEKFENKILIFGLRKIDKALEEELPEDFSQLLDDVSDGLEPGSDADLDLIKGHLVTFLNKKIDIPILGEKAEKELFEVAIDIIVDAMQKDKALAA